jgi:hypothetical protein
MSMTITEGIHTFTGKCPDCGRTQTFPLELGVQRTTTAADLLTAVDHLMNGTPTE